MKPTRPIQVLRAGRLPQGRYGGSLKGQGSLALGQAAIAGILADYNGPRPTRLHWGIARSHTQGMNPGRTLAVRAGLGLDVVGLTHNAACASGLAAVFAGIQALCLGEPGPVVVGGSEAMSDTPFLAPDLRWGWRFGHQTLPDVMHQDGLCCPMTGLLMGQTIERLVAKHGIQREAADAYALESHRRALAADFTPECIPHSLLDQDECRRVDLSLEDLSAMPPFFEPWGQVTAGNASAISDGAAALLLGREEHGSGREPLARILAWSEVALDPMDMGYGPVPAVQQLLTEAQCTVGDIAHWELNEAFAAQVLCCAQALDLPLDRLNPVGGGIALGHPIGASGARILVTLIHQLRAKGGGLGVATLGIGGGLGQAVLVETR